MSEPTRPYMTPAKLTTALLQRGILTELGLVGLLGEARHTGDLNTLEVALIRENILSKDALLALKGEVSGLPVYDNQTIGVTSYLPVQVADDHGAIVLDRNPLTVAMVEDTLENLQAVGAALRTPFEVWLVTVPQFEELRRVAYHNQFADDRPVCPDLWTILDAAVRMRASDVHLSVGVPPRLRVDGGLAHLPFQPLDKLFMRTAAEALAEQRHLDELAETFSADLAYSYGTARFRVNIANDAHGHTMALRKLPSKIPTPEEIGLPDSIRSFAHLERGMVLVTGPTGSGKSTTLAALLHEIVTGSSRHVITLEDPIEFRLPTDKASHVNQRELGQSFNSFAEGLRDALRQDPDVILVGELRDSETIKTAITAAETGHMVLGTLHTYDAGSTIMRLVNSFPADEQDAVRAQLSQLLKGVVSQTLIPRAATKGRVAAYEIMLNTPAIQTNLRKPDGHNQIKQTMQTSANDGMQTMESSLADLVHRGIIKRQDAEFRARSLDDFTRQLEHREAGKQR